MENQIKEFIAEFLRLSGYENLIEELNEIFPEENQLEGAFRLLRPNNVEQILNEYREKSTDEKQEIISKYISEIYKKLIALTVTLESDGQDVISLSLESWRNIQGVNNN